MFEFIQNPKYVRQFQKLCGIDENKENKNVIINSYVIYYFFKVITSTADEIGYIIWLPFICWNIPFGDIVVRKVILSWLTTMYIGQVIKELFKIPRPSYPVLQLEKHFATEYGFPSTHAMGSACYTLYTIWCFHTNNQFTENHIIPAYTFGFIFVFLVSLSRLYLGVHSMIDVIAGLIFGFMCLMFFISYGTIIDNWILSAKIYQLVLIGILLLFMYPKPNSVFTSCYGTTSLIIGTAIGISCGFISRYNNKSSPMTLPQFQVLKSIIRLVTGLVILACIRFIVKPMCIWMMKHYAYNIQKVTVPTKHSYTVDVPTKFLTYYIIGYSAATLVPFVFFNIKYINISIRTNHLFYLC